MGRGTGVVLLREGDQQVVLRMRLGALLFSPPTPLGAAATTKKMPWEGAITL